MLTYHPPLPIPKCVLLFAIVHKSNKAIINFHLYDSRLGYLVLRTLKLCGRTITQMVP